MTSENQDSQTSRSSRAVAWAPASLSNLGPGFDCLGLAIADWGDTVEALRNDIDRSLTIRFLDESPWHGPTDPRLNTAGVAARSVVNILGETAGVDLIIRKGVVPGSGVGSSAASAAAAAWAVNLLLGCPLSKEDLVESVLEGESVAAGARHGDNVLPSLFGGILVVSAENPRVFRRMEVVVEPVITVLLPKLNILTREAREMLSDVVAFKTSVANASNLALLVSALQAGDWSAAGHFMMMDRIVEPARAALVPEFEAIRTAALDAGAFGCALSGSGPALFAISESEALGSRILEAMQAAARSRGRAAEGIVTRLELNGAREITVHPES